MTEFAPAVVRTDNPADAKVDASVALKNKAFAKIYSGRMSRDELRASMIAKAKDVVEKGIGSLDLVTVVEHR
ncbi:hypothetical protein [Pseudomonas fluorescens]|uniref:Uncharacterized protein n=1 Tax=Pseudomonas fluorescens TaxID=294 RepID=A0A5E7CA21_PSEFL|nr:hypothetical protein [Pseudomonas fluorescens]VVO01599.1 hypothetical protein PS710_02714 [Pseudomonas fluorescens]